MSLFIILQTYLTLPGVIGLFALIAFLAVYVVRKKYGPQWERLTIYVPALGFDMTPGTVILNKFIQALPSVVIGAVLGAVTSGASLGPTLLAAIAGLLAPLGHEFAKAVPFIPYKGETGEAKLPGAPKLPTGIAGLIIALSLFSCSPSAIKDPCTAADKAKIQADYSAEFMQKCFPFESAAACPFTDELRAKRAKNEEKCR